MDTVRFTFPKRFRGPGRTMREAINDGTYFALEVDGRTVTDGFPGCRTIRDALRAAVFNRCVKSGDVVKVYRHLPESTIGCAFLEEVDSFRVEVTS